MDELRRLTAERVVHEIDRIVTDGAIDGWYLGASKVSLFHSGTQYRLHLEGIFGWWWARVRGEHGATLQLFYLAGPWSDVTKAIRRLHRLEREQLVREKNRKRTRALEAIKRLPAPPETGTLAMADGSTEPTNG